MSLHFIFNSDLSNLSTIKCALDAIRLQSDVHLHDSISCTRCTIWQVIYIFSAKPEIRQHILFERQIYLEHVKTFGRPEKATVARGGSIAFGYSIRCEK